MSTTVNIGVRENSDSYRSYPGIRLATAETQLAGLRHLTRIASEQSEGARRAAQLAAQHQYRLQTVPYAPTVRYRRHRVIYAGMITGVVLGIVTGLHVVTLAGGHLGVQLGWYGTAVTIVIGLKLLLSLMFAADESSNQNVTDVLDDAKVAVVITLYNEDPSAFGQCLDSLLAQTRLPDAVTVVDDCSPDTRCKKIAHDRAWEFSVRGIDFDVIEFPENLGKRDGLAAGYRRTPDAFAYMCLDSDTLLERTAMARLLRPFAKGDVTAVTGCVLAANRTKNLLTRLLDLRYAYSFLGERAAYALIGSVLCVPGAGGMYRGDAVRKHMDAWLHQRFLGNQCTYGDDRHMTFWCLKEGRVVLAPDALAWTYVPERMSHFLRQQIRWSKSFFRESVWMLGRMAPTRACWWMTLVEMVTWAVFTGALLYSLALRPAITGHFSPWAYLASAVLLSYARAGHYSGAEHPGMGWGPRLAGLLLAPLYGIIHITLLLPLRLYALATLRDAKWGTRQTVEVEA